MKITSRGYTKHRIRSSKQRKIFLTVLDQSGEASHSLPLREEQILSTKRIKNNLTSSPGEAPTRQMSETILSASETLKEAANPRTSVV